MVGRKAAEAALAGEREGSVTIQRVSNDPYRVSYQLVKLTDVAAKTRTLDLKYIVNGNNIDAGFQQYLRPLAGTLPVIELLRSK
jgi:hypothetical protein